MNSSNGIRKRRILIVDDERLSVAGVELELEGRGFAVEFADTAAAAERLLGQNAYDAVLLDLMLPKNEVGQPKSDPALAETGLDLLGRLVNGEFGPPGTPRSVRVFVITALGPDEINVLTQVREQGVREIFHKPVRPVRVAEAMRLALEEP